MEKNSELELKLYHKILAYSLPKPKLEYKFHQSRKWRFDLAWDNYMLAVEVEGGIHSGGRHTTAKGYIADCEKYNAAQILGWTVIRFTREHIETEYAIDTLRAAFALNSIKVKK